MKSLNLLILSFLLSTLSFSQSFPACDSLVINCCTYNTFGPNTVSLTVANSSSVLFDYPGFVIFDSNMDTIAIETVNYFGIGTGPQIHTLNIVAPLTLPFSGYLNLYILFYDTLACSFPITLPDTTTGIMLLHDEQENVSVYPNPVDGTEVVTIKSNHMVSENLNLKITDPLGREVLNQFIIPEREGTLKFNASQILPGIYYINFKQNGKSYCKKFLKI